ncbi:hypothetical protein XELAEV_18018836mg [Xenopus laevis]|uniref:G-protein coupled receptors family 1 profile domain-containing protein n=1 Tax=Xenopus laevis TaxID=8355 RepID=A0A974DEI3_XENLA|nr:hypothetical protein XELAEV_18018836mg [Xenopus laevis]
MCTHGVTCGLCGFGLISHPPFWVTGCIVQDFVFGSCILAEFFLLTFMAYDRYVAISKALQYPLIVTKSICVLMASISWLIATLNSLIFAILPKNNTGNIKAVIYWESILFGFIPFILILISYMYIISAILKIHTSAGRLKTFSSCSSHLAIVILFWGPTISFYVSPETENSREQRKILSLLYTALVPMLNPLVYSLRNQDVGRAIRTFFQIKV